MLPPNDDDDDDDDIVLIPCNMVDMAHMVQTLTPTSYITALEFQCILYAHTPLLSYKGYRPLSPYLDT